MSLPKSPIIYIIIIIIVLSIVFFGYNVFYPEDNNIIDIPSIPSISSSSSSSSQSPSQSPSSSPLS